MHADAWKWRKDRRRKSLLWCVFGSGRSVLCHDHNLNQLDFQLVKSMAKKANNKNPVKRRSHPFKTTEQISAKNSRVCLIHTLSPTQTQRGERVCMWCSLPLYSSKSLSETLLPSLSNTVSFNLFKIHMYLDVLTYFNILCRQC